MNQRVVSRIRTGAAAAAVVAALAGYILVEKNIQSKKGEDMPVALPVPVFAQTKTNVEDEKAKSVVNSALTANYPITSAAMIVFNYLSTNISQTAKYDIIRSFVNKYGLPALSEIKNEAIRIGSTFYEEEKLKKENPALITRANALSFGIMLNGEKGFETAMDLVKLGKDMRSALKPGQYPLIYRIAGTAAMKSLDAKKVDKEKALASLAAAINDPNVQTPEKAIFMHWALDTKPEAVCGFLGSSSGEIRSMAESHMNGELKGKVSCK